MARAADAITPEQDPEAEDTPIIGGNEMNDIQKALTLLFCITVFAGCSVSDVPAQESSDITSVNTTVTEESIYMVKMPELMGLSSSEAKKVIEDLGLDFSAEEENSLEFPDDTVISQLPAAGEEIEGTDVISITINVIPSVIIPQLTGLSADEALKQLPAILPLPCCGLLKSHIFTS